MNKLSYCVALILMLYGCAGATLENSKDRFVNDRNYDVGRSVDLSYAMPASQVSSQNEKQDRYLFKNNVCEWVYYVNKNTKVVDSWEYVSSPDKCSTGLDWFGIW